MIFYFQPANDQGRPYDHGERADVIWALRASSLMLEMHLRL